MTAVLDRDTTDDSEIIDLDSSLVVKCHITGRTAKDHDDSAERHHMHRRRTTCKTIARQRRSRELTEAQNRALFEGTIDLDEIDGCKLTKRQRAQVRMLRAQRAGRPVKASTRKKATQVETTARPHNKPRESDPEERMPMGKLLHELGSTWNATPRSASTDSPCT